MEQQQQARFEGWAIVDVLGHQRYVGYVTTEAYGQAVLFRIDVPQLEERERVTKRPEYIGDQYCPAGTTVQEGPVAGYSKLVGSGSIYAITPCSKEAALAAVDEMQRRPLMSVQLPKDRALPAPRDAEDLREIPDFDDHDDQMEDEDPRVVLDEWIRDSSLAKVLEDLKDAVAPHEPGHPELERQVAILQHAKGLVQHEGMWPHDANLTGAGPSLRMIADERDHQIAQGYTAEHDDAEAANGTLGAGAGWLLHSANPFQYAATESPGWVDDLVVKHKGNPIALLIRAGALVAAEIDRLKRKAATAPESETSAATEPPPVPVFTDPKVEDIQI